jgi:hypothetical protein
MRRPFLKYTASMALACAAAATPLFAQVNTGVGADATTHTYANWTVGANNTATGMYTLGNAALVQPTPGAWANTSPNSFWISTNATGSLPGGVGDNQPRVNYGYKTIFTSGADPIQMTVWTDNVFIGLTLDGSAVVPGGFAPPSTPFGPQVFTFSPATSGEHTLLLYTVGDGLTDGINVQFSSVPEPSSMALLGTGLVGLIPMIRRRRKS